MIPFIKYYHYFVLDHHFTPVIRRDLGRPAHGGGAAAGAAASNQFNSIQFNSIQFNLFNSIQGPELALVPKASRGNPCLLHLYPNAKTLDALGRGRMRLWCQRCTRRRSLRCLRSIDQLAARIGTAGFLACWRMTTLRPIAPGEMQSTGSRAYRAPECGTD